MADMADFVNEQFEQDEGYFALREKPKTCKHCKKRGLHWKQTKDGSL